ncbi:hypothetical protein QQG91_04440 [Marivivens sp. LCG002]|uniref:hypothetical protein n=1 Tax=Marivivens sp. LCG002 TaxID=3051171 RepID=UPI0025555CF9|nr:hypothetical protein [Marivivens sp. LCG002]WIV51700.1 hypothetical protein QQG91_04440 [Marivivens sp. LCG002]
MIKMRLAFPFIALALATPVFADEAVDKLVVAIEEAGCVVTMQNGDAVYAASGLSEEEIFAAVQKLYEQGLVSLEADGSMSLKSDVCQ